MRACFSRDRMQGVTCEQCTGLLNSAEQVLRKGACSTPADGLLLHVCAEVVAVVAMALFDSASAEAVDSAFRGVAQRKCRECGRETQKDWKRCPWCEAKLGSAGDSLVSRLFQALVGLLFVPGFTLGAEAPSGRPWALGETLEASVVESRHVILDALLVLLSQPLRIKASGTAWFSSTCSVILH